ncbi:Flavanone 3-dioxygenase 2 [Linum grandiflorum]
MAEIDPSFIQEAVYRPNPKLTHEASQIPIIDLSSSPAESLISQIGDACEKWGFFQAINHGVPPELNRSMKRVGKELFDLEMEAKRKVKRDEFQPMGYHDGEHTKNVRDWKEVFDFSVVDPTFVPASEVARQLRELNNQWPLPVNTC